MNGFGTYYFPTGEIYNGEFKDDVMHGKGKFTWPDGKVYEGDYVNGKKSGFGTLKTKDAIYSGEWFDGV